jgi:hypothetical protein
MSNNSIIEVMALSWERFDFIIDENERNMYDTAFRAITELQLWEFIQKFSEDSFMHSTAPEIAQIYDKIQELGYRGHSGCSFGLTMHTMQYIAKKLVFMDFVKHA